MRHTCERIGCGREVAVVYGTVPGRDGSLTLWIDVFRPDTSAAREREIMGYVCRQHGERLAPPRGWLVDDRRESSPRLFRPQTNRSQPDAPQRNLTVVPDKPARSRKDKVRDLPRPSLFAESTPSDDTPTPIETAVAPTEPVIETPVVHDVIVSESPVVEAPVVDVPVVEAPVVETTVVEVPTDDEPPVRESRRESHVVTGPEPSVDPSGDATRAWAPYFDPDDDLDGMLNATGSMLRDAFRSRHNGRRNG